VLTCCSPVASLERGFRLDYARMHAVRGDVVAAAAQAGEGGDGGLASAGLGGLGAHFARVPRRAAGLARWVDAVARAVAP
jgi:hypothetical protein